MLDWGFVATVQEVAYIYRAWVPYAGQIAFEIQPRFAQPRRTLSDRHDGGLPGVKNPMKVGPISP